MRNQNRGYSSYGSGSTHETADAEFAGRIDSVGTEPQFLTGRVIALQSLGLTITDVRRGDASVGDQIDLGVEIVAGNPHVARGEMGLPALDGSMVQPGVLVVAWANRTDNGWQALEISTDGPSSRNENYAGRNRSGR